MKEISCADTKCLDREGRETRAGSPLPTLPEGWERAEGEGGWPLYVFRETGYKTYRCPIGCHLWAGDAPIVLRVCEAGRGSDSRKPPPLSLPEEVHRTGTNQCEDLGPATPASLPTPSSTSDIYTFGESPSRSPSPPNFAPPPPPPPLPTSSPPLSPASSSSSGDSQAPPPPPPEFDFGESRAEREAEAKKPVKVELRGGRGGPMRRARGHPQNWAANHSAPSPPARWSPPGQGVPHPCSLQFPVTLPSPPSEVCPGHEGAPSPPQGLPLEFWELMGHLGPSACKAGAFPEIVQYLKLLPPQVSIRVFRECLKLVRSGSVTNPSTFLGNCLEWEYNNLSQRSAPPPAARPTQAAQGPPQGYPPQTCA